MDPRLLRLYERELLYMREMGAEFAREYPKIAGRLGLETFECADPYVERLLEGFAFLAARVQLKIDAEFPRFSRHLLEIVYPNYLSPTPSMAVVQLQPNLGEGTLTAGYRVPRGSAMRSVIGRGEQTACEFRTAHDVTLWPVELTHVEYGGFVNDLGELTLSSRPRAALRMRLRTTGSQNFSDLPLDELAFFLRGSDELPMRLYEQLVGHTLALVARPPGRSAAGQHLVTRPVVSMGFDDSEALLHNGARSFQGYRLLHEYFAFPDRFLFVKVRGLAEAVRHHASDEIEFVVLSDLHDKALDGTVSVQNVALNCTPVVNLFPRRADRIHLTEMTNEYHVLADRTRPMDFEVYSVSEVTGFGGDTETKQPFRPFFAWNDQTGAGSSPAYFTVNRQPRTLSAKQRANGTRSSYVGSEVFLSLVDQDEGPYRSHLRQLEVATMCTNRDLPLHLTLGQGRTDFNLDSGGPIESVRCLAGPTPPRASHAHGDTSWRLISHLSLNYLSLVDSPNGEGAAALRELLSLYADLSDAGTLKQIDGLRSTSSMSITRPLPVSGPTTFGRGLEITLTCDEHAFQGSGVFLMGAVLERFLAKYVSINSFTETVLRTVQRGEIMRWPTRLGLRATA